MIFRKYKKTTLLLIVLLIAWGVSYSWTYTPHGRLDYTAALSLRLLSFTTTLKPHPDSDFELTMPVNLIHALSAKMPRAEVSKTEDIRIPSATGEIPARIYWPAGYDPSHPPPLVVYYHGGGFVVGSVAIFDPLARKIANASEAVVISVDYRLAPTHPYPAAVDDCYEALLWAAANAASLGADPNRLVVAGDSAGGHLATVTAMRARDEGTPAVKAQILYYPGTDLTEKRYDSSEKFTDGYGLSSEAMQTFREAFVGHLTGEERAQPYVSPLYAQSHADMPPALIITAGFDPLTDSAHLYARRLEDSQVTVEVRHYPDTIHGFMSVSLFSQQQDALEDTARFLKSVL